MPTRIFFSVNRLNYPVKSRRFIATVQMQRMLISDKALALATALDKKVEMLEQIVRGLHYDALTYAGLIAELEKLFGGADQEIATTVADLLKGPRIQLNSLDLVRGFRVKIASYTATLETYGKREAEFSPQSQLYRELQDRKISQQDLLRFQDRRSDKGWPESADGILSWLDHHQSILESAQQATKTPTMFSKDQLNVAFMTTEGHNLMCTGNEAAAHEVALDEFTYIFTYLNIFKAYDDTPVEVLQHMLNISRKSGREVLKIMACDWRQTQCTSNHLLRECPIYKALSNKEKLDHILRTRRCFNCYKKDHRASAFTSVIRCATCKKDKGREEKHNTALHEAWQEKTEVLAFLTRNIYPISLLTSPIMVGRIILV
jgi:hypothetical protein